MDPACTGPRRTDGVVHCLPGCTLRDVSDRRTRPIVRCSGVSCGCHHDPGESAPARVLCGCTYTTHCNMDGECSQHSPGALHCSCVSQTVFQLNRVVTTVLQNQQPVIDAYMRARNPDARLVSCASCGLRESTADNTYKRFPISDLGVYKYTSPATVAVALGVLLAARLEETAVRDRFRTTLTLASIVPPELLKAINAVTVATAAHIRIAARGALDDVRVARIVAARQQCDEVTGISFDHVFSSWSLDLQQVPSPALDLSERIPAHTMLSTASVDHSYNPRDPAQFPKVLLPICPEARQRAKNLFASYNPNIADAASVPQYTSRRSDEFESWYLQPEFVDPPAVYSDADSKIVDKCTKEHSALLCRLCSKGAEDGVLPLECNAVHDYGDLRRVGIRALTPLEHMAIATRRTYMSVCKLSLANAGSGEFPVLRSQAITFCQPTAPRLVAGCAVAMELAAAQAAQEADSEADVWSDPAEHGGHYVQTLLMPSPAQLPVPPVVCDSFRTLCDCDICVPRTVLPAVDLHMRTSVVLVGPELQREQQLAQKAPFGSRFNVDLCILLRTMRACKAIGNTEYVGVDIPCKQANAVAYAGHTLPGKPEVPDWRSPVPLELRVPFDGPLSYLGAAGEQFAAADAYYSGDKDAAGSFLGHVVAEARVKSTSDPDVIREDVIAANSDPSAALPQAGADHGDGPARLAADPVIIYEDLYVGSNDGSVEVCWLRVSHVVVTPP